MIKKIEWNVDDNSDLDIFFENNYSNFKNMAGDMETLLFNCKISHSKRVFCKKDLYKKLTIEDIKNGFIKFNNSRGINDIKKDESWKYLYI